MKEQVFHKRVKVLQWGLVAVFVLFIGKMFDLQVLKHEDFYAEAKAQHEKRFVLSPRRGKIFVKKNRLTKELTPLATNNTLKMLFVDPVVMTYPSFNPRVDLAEQDRGNPELVAEMLAKAETLVQVDLPASDGAALAWLYDVADVREASGEGATMSLTVSISDADAQRFEKRFGYDLSGG